MDKTAVNSADNTSAAIIVISKLVQDIESKSLQGVKSKDFQYEEIKLLKEKCCDKNVITSNTALYAINHLVRKRILSGSQTISMLVSLLPGIEHYSSLVSVIGDILLFNLQESVSQKGTYHCPYTAKEFKHPFTIILKHNREKSWYEICLFIVKLLLKCNEIKLEHKIELIRPIYRHVFWSQTWTGSQLQLKLFNILMMHIDHKEIIDFTLEVLMWQSIDLCYCLFLQEFLLCLLKGKSSENQLVISALTPMLALAIKWLISKGIEPVIWIEILESCLKMDNSANSVVLYILSDVLVETPLSYINLIVDVCKTIILSASCNKYCAYKFGAVVLNWFINPSFLVNSLYNTLESIVEFLNERKNIWSDHTSNLINNQYFKVYGNTNEVVKFAVNLILMSEEWCDNEKSVFSWLKNLNDSNQYTIQLKLHTFLYGMILCLDDKKSVDMCLNILFKLIDAYKDISFSFLCLIFYKLSRETDPYMQKTYLFCLPKLGVKKENLPVIVGIIESLKKGHSKVMIPLVIQLYLLLWKFDNRTYSYLHKILHDSSYERYSWELNVSKAMALREICRLAPHLHAKDLVSILSKILNECAGHTSGLPSAIAIEAVTELCKSFVIDVTGTWNALRPILSLDKRPQVIISLCKFFREISKLDSPGQKLDQITREVIPMLWNFTFLNDVEITKNSLEALSNFELENLPLALIPQVYKTDLKLPKDPDNKLKAPEDILTLSYVPAEVWLKFLQKVDEKVLQDGGKLLTVLMERELTSLPRGLFYLPPEKAEPPSYSYLPHRSICRALVDRLQKHPSHSDLESYKIEIIRIMSHEYSKLLPPLNWCFMESFLNLESTLHLSLKLLAKQGSISTSAKSILDNFFKSIQWTDKKVEDISRFYELLPFLCKGVSYNVFQNFLYDTIEVAVQAAVKNNFSCLSKILEEFRKVLESKTTEAGHKKIIVKHLEGISNAIPANNQIMKDYALCASNFPVQSIENLTVIEDLKEVDSDWLHRAITIRNAIAMRPDINNPLIWLNELSHAVPQFPSEENYMLETIWTIIRQRRSSDHSTWLQDLIWRIQAPFTTSMTNETIKVTLFLIDMFISATIVLSGYDCLFVDVSEFSTNKEKKFDLFPQAFCMLFHFPEWNDLLPKVAQWIEKLSKWKHLPPIYVSTFIQSLLKVKEAKTLSDENTISYLFNVYMLES